MQNTPTQIPTVMPTSNRPQNAGKSMDDVTSRLDAVAKVTGRAKYGRDRFLPNSIFAAFVRCPWGAGELTAHDADAARGAKGVVDVSVEPRACRYHGQTVGHVAADSLLALRRGMKALACTWKRGVSTTRIDNDLGDAFAPNDDTRELLSTCDHVLEAVYTTEVQTHSSLETHGAVVDHTGDEATVYASTQGTFSAMDGLEDDLGLPRNKYRIVCEFVGGGFGSKLGGAGKESALAARLSARFKRPCYCFCSREEEHLDTGNRPSSRTQVKIGFGKDGSVKGGFIATWGGVGVGGGGGVNIPTGRYRLGQIERPRNRDVRFNAGAPRAMRAPGWPQAAFAEELMLDEIAAIAGVDPLSLRMDHCAHPDRREMLEQGAAMIGWKNRPAMGSQKGVLRRGMGIGSCAWGRFPAPSQAEVVINRDGSVLCKTGSQDIGTGQRTAMAIVAAEVLGVPLSAVQVAIGDSTLPQAPGSGGSVTCTNTSISMAAAATEARQKLLEHVGAGAGVPAAELEVKDGSITRAGAPLMTWAQAAGTLGPDGIAGRGASGRDRVSGHSEGVQLVDLRVDIETGVVHLDRVVAIQSCGRVVCRKTAESQIIGGVIQGLSYALFEDRLLDRMTGAMVNPNLEWYKIAGPADMPLIEPVLWHAPKADIMPLGEPPVIPTAGAIACAIFNAIGRPVRSLPMSPDKVLSAIG